MAGKRRPLLQVVQEGFSFMPFRRKSARLKDPPPWHGASVVAHHSPNLPRPTGPQELGNVTVRHRGAWRDQLHQGQHSLDILIPHGSTVSAVALANTVGGAR